MRNLRAISMTGIYHVILRGNNKQMLFFEKVDYYKFIDILKTMQYEEDDFGREIHNYCLYAYCLMPNHVHLLIKTIDTPISQCMSKINVSYAMYYNIHYDHTGHVFQDRYRSEPCEDMDYFKTLLRYIHQNPVKGGLCPKVSDYKWSSWKEFVAKSKMTICDTSAVLKRISLLELNNLVNEMLNDDVKCIDYRQKISDEDIVEMICEKSACETISEFQRCGLDEQLRVLAECHTKGISLRRLARFSSLSRSTVIRRLGGA